MKRISLIAIMLSTFLNMGWAGSLEDGISAFDAKQYERALPLLQHAAEAGELKAQSILARMYFNGWGIAKDYKLALKWGKPAADRGEAPAQNNLGTMYNFGYGVIVNYAEAERLYRLSAAQGNSFAQANLGSMYLKGQGVDKDYTEAMKWFQVSADLGNETGQNSMGYMYELGLGVKQDFEEAARWYLLTASKGNTFGKSKLEIAVIKKASTNVVAKKDIKRKGDSIFSNDLKTNSVMAGSVSRKELEDMGEAILKNDLVKNSKIVEAAISKSKKEELDALQKAKSEALAAQLQQAAEQQKLALGKPVSLAAVTVNSNNSEKLQSSQQNVVMAQRRALVIGNDSYSNVGKLQNAREDARAIAANLQQLGYKVTLEIDLNQKDMKAALRNFKLQIDGGDEVMIFYAGHGVQIGAANYLLPVDILGESEDQIKDDGVQLQKILDDMSERKAKFTLAMIDACRDNPFKSAKRQLGGRGLSPTTAATGQMVVFSAGTGQQALDKVGPVDKNKNGLFTRIFLKEMQKPGISIDRVVRNVRTEVVSIAQSIGHEQVPAIYDQVIGEFYFRR